MKGGGGGACVYITTCGVSGVVKGRGGGGGTCAGLHVCAGLVQCDSVRACVSLGGHVCPWVATCACVGFKSKLNIKLGGNRFLSGSYPMWKCYQHCSGYKISMKIVVYFSLEIVCGCSSR